MGGGSTTGGDPAAAQASLEARERALQLSQQMSQINNGYNEQQTAMQSQIAQAKMQRAQCDSTLAQQEMDANNQAEQAKQQNLQNMMGSMMGPASQMLGNMANGETKKDKEMFNNMSGQYNNALTNVSQYIPVDGGQFTMPSTPKEVEKSPTPNFALLKSQCRNAVANHSGVPTPGAVPGAGVNRAEMDCRDAVMDAENKYNQARQAAMRAKEGEGQMMATMASTAVIAGAGLWGYSTGNKSAKAQKDAALTSADMSYESCVNQANQQIADLNRQLAGLEARRQDEIKFAKQAAALAEDAAKLVAPKMGPNPNPGLPINPDSLGDGSNLMAGATIGDPELPSDAANGNENGNSNAASPAALAGAGGAGPGGGGAGGSDGSANWTFGSPYPSNVGGGGLPTDQPGAANYLAEGGGAGGFFGFGSPEEAFESFGSMAEFDEAARAVAGTGDGGLNNMLRRARQRLTAHAAELLAPSNINTVARRSPEPDAPDSKRKAASITRY
jgi:hypothetical protein